VFGGNLKCRRYVETDKMADSTPRKTQRISRSAMDRLWKYATSKRQDPFYADMLKQLNAFYLARKSGSHPDFIELEVEYNLSTKSKAGSLGYGRFYGSHGSLERMQSDVRATLCHGIYADIDIQNCHPNLLIQLAKRDYRFDMPAFREYVDNRGAFLDFLENHYDVSKMEAKALILSIPYGGNLIKDAPEVLQAMKAEADYVITQMMRDDRYKTLIATLRSDKKSNLSGRFLSYVLQTEERKCLLALDAELTRLGFSPDVLAYDGVMVRLDERLTSARLAEIQEAIATTTGYTLCLREKPLTPMDISTLEAPSEAEMDSTEVAPGIPYSKFKEIQAEFEKTHFYYSSLDAVAHLEEDGTLTFVKVKGGHAARALNMHDFEDPKKPRHFVQFIPLWLAQKDRYSCDTIDFKPSTNKRVFSPPLRFAWQRAEADATAAACVDAFHELLGIVCNHDKAAEHYVLRWLAHILQQPFDLPGTAIIITGSKGTGKDTFGDFISEFLVGDMYSVSYGRGSQYFDSHDTGCLNKFFCKIEEMHTIMTEEHESDFKSSITERRSRFNPKGVGAFDSANYRRVMGTTNNANPLKLTDKERRFLLIPCSAEKQGDHAYFTGLRKLLFNERGGAAVGKYLAELPLADFNVRLLPALEYQEAMADIGRSSEDQFIDAWEGAKSTATEFYTAYTTYCSEHGLPYCQNVISFTKRIAKFVRDGQIVKQKCERANYYATPAAGGAGA